MLNIILMGLVVVLLVILRRVSRYIAKCGTCRYQATLPCGMFCSSCKNFDLWQPMEEEV